MVLRPPMTVRRALALALGLGLLLAVLLPSPSHAHEAGGGSGGSSSRPPRPKGPLSSLSSGGGNGGGGMDKQAVADLAKLFKEQEERELAKLEAQEQAVLDQHTTVDARGVRRPADRGLVFLPPGASSQAPPSPQQDAAPAPAAAGASQGSGMDVGLLRQALRARSDRVQQLTTFRSKRNRELEARRRRSKFSPLIQLRVRFPDGAALQAQFHPGETVQDVMALVHGAFRPPYDTPGAAEASPFTLLSLGALPGKRQPGRKALGGDAATRNLTLAEVGLSPPAATLLLHWRGKRGEDAVFPKATAAWIKEELLAPAATRTSEDQQPSAAAAAVGNGQDSGLGDEL